MQNLSDNELDDSFRQAAAEHQPAFDPRGWEAMQKRLDSLPKEEGLARFSFYSDLLGVLILLFLAVLPYGSLLVQNEDVVVHQAGLEVSGDRNNKDVDKIEAYVQRERESIPRVGKSLVEDENLSKGGDQNVAKVTSTIDFNVHQIRTEQSESAENGSDGSSNKDLIHRGIAITKNDSIVNENKTLVVAEADSTANMSEEEKDEEKDDKDDKEPTWHFAVVAVASPDFSSIDFTEHTRAGWNYGLLLEYFINRNLSIQTGGISSKKIYTGSDIEYNGHRASRAEGSCRVIDIPFNVYYRFNARSQRTFFASAGISSYIMQKEDYVFSYSSYYGTSAYSKHVRNENKEWFKILNLSAGFSQVLSSRFRIDAEPFVKLPLTGIGAGNLNVNSFGCFFKVSYLFNVKIKQTIPHEIQD